MIGQSVRDLVEVCERFGQHNPKGKGCLRLRGAVFTRRKKPSFEGTVGVNSSRSISSFSTSISVSPCNPGGSIASVEKIYLASYLRILDFRQVWSAPRGKISDLSAWLRKFSDNSSFSSKSSLIRYYYLFYYDTFVLLFGIADLTRPQLPKCNNHLVSFIKVYGLFVPYIVDIFYTIKSRTMVYRSMDCRHFWHH